MTTTVSACCGAPLKEGSHSGDVCSKCDKWTTPTNPPTETVSKDSLFSKKILDRQHEFGLWATGKKPPTDPTVPKKSKEQQIVDWLISKEISFPRIASIYSTYLEEKWKFDREQVVDLAMIANMYRTPKNNGGSKKDLETRFAKAMLKTKLFQGTPFQKELEKKV